jgi:UDP-N-acetylglucosamine--N-acetylmuramyl-(pentapeptide) pyrophosphoryl-undecaprenol N-acetylglucosamine transferase
MSSPATKSPFIAIACGGTGGHLFPGLAVAGQLQQRGCTVALLISPKDVDQQAVKSALERRPPDRHGSVDVQKLAGQETGAPLEIFTLPAVALQNRNYFSFVRSFWQSWRAAKKIFQARPPQAVLAMGGFTSAPPVLAGNAFGARTFLHESNTIPGKANRFLAWFVDEAFVGFPEAGSRLKSCKVTTTGTPVRPQFSGWWGETPDEPVLARQTTAATAREDARPTRSAKCRATLGLDPNRPTILVMGGSQGASGLNEMILSALPLLAPKNWQWLHLTGANDFEKVTAAYATHGVKTVVKSFLTEMDLALGAATASVSRSGASSLAEIAAMRLPSLLVPYPTAADNHQFINARAFEKTGAAKLLEQKDSTPEKVAALLTELVEIEATRATMQAALAQWHAPKAAEQIAEIILAAIAQPAKAAQAKAKKCGCGHAHGSAKHAH